jgi:hypothetical protein
VFFDRAAQRDLVVGKREVHGRLQFAIRVMPDAIIASISAAA